MSSFFIILSWLTSISSFNTPLNCILVPSLGCMTSTWITSTFDKFIFLPTSNAAASAVSLSVGKNRSTVTTPSPNHCTSGFMMFVFLYAFVWSIRLYTLSSSSSSSMNCILSGFSNVDPSINDSGWSFIPYCSILLNP